MDGAASECDLCIVHNVDANAWKDYIVRVVTQFLKRRGAPPLRITSIDDASLTKTGGGLPPSAIIVVILSPAHLDFLRSHHTVNYRKLVDTRTTNAMVLRCGVACFGDLADQDKAVFTQFFGWTKLEDIDNGDPVCKAVSRLMSRRSTQDPEISETPDAHSLPSSSTSSRRANSFTSDPRSNHSSGGLTATPTGGNVCAETSDDLPHFRVIPTTIRCEGSHEVVVALNDDVAASADDVQLSLELDGRRQPVEMTTRLNSRALTFTAPSAPDGTMATVTVRTAVGAVLGHVTLTYEADVTGDILQIYGRLLDAACSAMIDQSLVTPPLLDAILTGAVFDDTGSRSSAHELPLRAFELLFESAKYAASESMVSETPTLMHFAAKYTLRHMCDKLLDLPDSNHACLLSNVDGQRPSQLATVNGLDDLATRLNPQHNPREVKTAVKKPTIYRSVSQTDREKLSTRVPISPNTRGLTGKEESVYIKMNRGSCSSVRESNISTASSGIDVQECISDEEGPLPAQFPPPPLQPRRKQSDPFVALPPTMLHTRRPSLPGPESAPTPPRPRYPPGVKQKSSPFHIGQR